MSIHYTTREAIAALPGKTVKPWRDGDAKCHCTHCAVRTGAEAHQAQDSEGAVSTTEVSVWAITVNGWGSTQMVATEAEAEEFRAHKANWERGVGRKSRLTGATPQELARYATEGAHHLG